MSPVVPVLVFEFVLLAVIAVSSAGVMSRLRRRRQRAFVAPAVSLLVSLEVVLIYFGGVPGVRVPAFVVFLCLGVALSALAGEGRGWIVAATLAGVGQAGWMLGVLPARVVLGCLLAGALVCMAVMAVVAVRGHARGVRRWGAGGVLCLAGATALTVAGTFAPGTGVAFVAAAALLALLTAGTTWGRCSST